VVSNIRDHPIFKENPRIRDGAVVGLPLKMGKRVVGVMNIEYHQPRVWPESELRVLYLLADQAAIAIENANLFRQAQDEITERKRAEVKLNEYREHLEDLVKERTVELEQAMLEAADTRDKIDAILQSVADGLIVTDSVHNVILANPAAETLLGISLNHIWGHAIGTGIKDNRLQEMVRRAFDQQSSSHEIDIRPNDTSDTRKKVLRARTALVNDRQGNPQGTVTIIQDVTRLREIDRLKSELLTTTAHELRTPLTSILGFSEILLTRDLIKDRQQHYLSMINEQSSHLAKIVSELVDLSRMEAGYGMELVLEEINLADLMNEVVILCAEKSAKHTIQLKDLADLPPIQGDMFRLTQVGQNLLTNAINYSPHGGTITIQGQVMPGYVQISLRDEGIGMTPEQQEHLFKPFYRAHVSHTAIGGTGLGLATSKLIIEQHGGEIWIDSKENVGTSVYFTLPQRQ
jgi:PAS domain S-box-containing protein